MILSSYDVGRFRAAAIAQFRHAGIVVPCNRLYLQSACVIVVRRPGSLSLPTEQQRSPDGSWSDVELPHNFTPNYRGHNGCEKLLYIITLSNSIKQ